LDINDKISDWKKQLEQANEYGLFFDKEIAQEMLEIIEQQQVEIDKLVFEREGTKHIKSKGKTIKELEFTPIKWDED
jgi:hypothetical protein